MSKFKLDFDRPTPDVEDDFFSPNRVIPPDTQGLSFHSANYHCVGEDKQYIGLAWLEGKPAIFFGTLPDDWDGEGTIMDTHQGNRTAVTFNSYDHAKIVYDLLTSEPVVQKPLWLRVATKGYRGLRWMKRIALGRVT